MLSRKRRPGCCVACARRGSPSAPCSARVSDPAGTADRRSPQWLFDIGSKTVWLLLGIACFAADAQEPTRPGDDVGPANKATAESPLKEAEGLCVETLVRREMEQQKIPGLSLAVVRDGQLVLAKGFGLANIEWQRSGHSGDRLSAPVGHEKLHGHGHHDVGGRGENWPRRPAPRSF